MKIISKSVESYLINEVKEGINTKGEKWYLAQLENSDGRINLFCQKYNTDKIKANVGNKCYLITEYVENYNKNTKKTYVGHTLKDIELIG